MANEVGKVEVHPEGIGVAHIELPAISVQGIGGRVVAYIGSDPRNYAEVYVDFIADDGRVMQLACVGQGHCDGDDPDMHAYVWSGTEECSTHNHDIEVSERSYWYEYKEGCVLRHDG